MDELLSMTSSFSVVLVLFAFGVLSPALLGNVVYVGQTIRRLCQPA